MLRASVLLLHCRLDINNNTPSEGVHVLTTANLGVFSLGYFYGMAMIKMSRKCFTMLLLLYVKTTFHERNNNNFSKV